MLRFEKPKIFFCHATVLLSAHIGFLFLSVVVVEVISAFSSKHSVVSIHKKPFKLRSILFVPTQSSIASISPQSWHTTWDRILQRNISVE